MLQKPAIILILLLAFQLFLSSCTTNVIFENNNALPLDGWEQENKIFFEVEITDTINLYDMFVNVRNSTSFAYSNLYLFLDIDFPGGRRVRDTLECIISDKTGKWTGRGVGRIKSNQFLFRTDVWFPEKGIYNFTFQQAMRTSNLEEIIDIGLRVERK